MKRTALVTGAAGFIGSHLVDRLLEQGYHVIGIDNFRTGKIENISEVLDHQDFTLVKADICDTNIQSKIPDSVDYVFHLAAIASVELSVRDPLLINRNNVTGTVNMLELARRLDVQRFVFVSSAAVYGAPERFPVTEDMAVRALSPYGASKIAGEQYTESYRNSFGLETVILRYFNVYGPRQAFSEYSGVVSIFVNQALRDDNLVINGDGQQVRSLIYVDDVVTFTIKAAEVPNANGMIINIAGAESITVQEIANLVLELIPDSKSKIKYDPPRPGDIRESVGSIERLCLILGLQPEVPFREGLRRTIEWYRNWMS